MAHAFTASVRSAALSRRVGAAILNADGDLVSLERNDVPKSGGGLYEADDGHGDHRYAYRKKSFPILPEDVTGADSNDLVKLEMLQDLFNAAIDGGVITAEREGILAALLSSPPVRASQFFEVIAYGRTVHAEMDAITTAARNGVSTKDRTVYVTTFPCHECARHIVAAGIKEVIYVEPYPKSRVGQLLDDSIQLADDCASIVDDDPRVLFRPFTGLASSRLSSFYSLERRKHDDHENVFNYGHAVEWKMTRDSRVRNRSSETSWRRNSHQKP